MKRIKRNIDILKALNNIPTSAIPKVVPYLNNDCIKAIGEIVVNILDGRVPINENQKTILQKYKKSLRNVKSCCVNKGNRNKLRQTITNQKGGFIPALLAPILPLLGKAILGSAVTAGTSYLTNKLTNGK